MTDSKDRVSIELIDAGDHKDRVVLVLSKVKGLTMAPQQVVTNTPCTVAANVPRQVAEKLQGFLEKAGAMVMLEGEGEDEEEDLFSTSEFPLPEEEESTEIEQIEVEQPEVEQIELEPIGVEPPEELSESSEEELFSESEQMLPPELPTPGLPESETEEGDVVEEKKAGTFQKLLSGLPGLGQKKEQTEAGAETEKPEKKPALAFLSKFRKPKIETESETEPETGPSEEAPAEFHEPVEVPEKKTPNLISGPVIMAIIGFLIGVVVMGTWGLLSNRSLERKWEQRMLDYETQTAQQIEQESADLKNKLNQFLQENTALNEQIATLTTQLEEARQPKSIIPSQTPDMLGRTPAQETLTKSFEELMAVHTQSLENGYDAQKQAGCSQQLLLDGKGTYTYAQVVKKFISEYTTYDIMKSDSIITPYVAEFKIPFQQEIRTGDTEEACNAATLEQIETPRHHEFGGYYGYWTIQYEYKDGKWVVKQTVIEKNRALYESAFQNGSPDYAKFRIDTALFPEFKTP